jgi:hypothetical protein
MTTVKVAVRVRPFNKREKERESRTIIEMLPGNKTAIENPENGDKKEYTFDYSYWSHDGFIEPDTDGGYLNPQPGSRYDDQNKVYKDLGIEVLDNAFDGFNACLFAYGQTGSGKSYSIVGYGENKGIIPRVCDEIFNRIHKRESDPTNRIQHEVKLQMLQVYNEKVQDLLVKKTSKPKEDL